MHSRDLLDHKRNVHSQNGEDGILETIFEAIGDGKRSCCEFGAWDGVHLSNCRSLVEKGWRALFIEGEPNRFQDLVRNYESNPLVTPLHRFVDSGANSLDRILEETGFVDLDFLSIDIDGLDYEILEGLESRPRVICVEVNAGHDPARASQIPRDTAKDNVGQSLARFAASAKTLGYELVCYTGNAFFVREEICAAHDLPVLDAATAYRNFLRHLDVAAKEWLFLVNLALVPPYYSYANPHLNRAELGISRVRALRLALVGRVRAWARRGARATVPSES